MTLRGAEGGYRQTEEKGPGQQGGWRWSDATASQGCQLLLRAGRGGKAPPPGPQGTPAHRHLHPSPVVQSLDFGFQNCCFTSSADLQKTSTPWTEQPQSSEAKSAISYPGLGPVGWPVSSADQTGLSGGWSFPPPPSSWDRRTGLGDALCAGRAEGAV